MKAGYAATIFHVNDVEASIKYYQDVLGFKVDFRYGDFAGIVYDGVVIYLSGPTKEVKKIVGQGSIYVFCDEIDNYYNQIIAKGAILSIEIENREYGMRDFAILDPDSNYITFGTDCDS